MVSRFTIFTVLAAAAGSVLGQLRIETPLNVVVCRPVQFTFSGGEGPYFLTAHPADQPAAPATVDFDEVESSPFRWVPNLPAGTSLFLRLQDQTGETAESGSFTILTGSDTSCIGQAESSDGTPAPTDSGAPSASGSAAPAPTPSASGSSPAASSSAAPASSGVSTSRTPSSSGASGSGSARPSSSGRPAAEDDGAAFTNYVSTGALGLAAIAGAAILL